MLLNELINAGFVKVDMNGGSLVKVVLYNPRTDEVKDITVDDREYDEFCSNGLVDTEFTASERVKLYDMPIDKTAAKNYKAVNGIPEYGMRFEVVKGRKYPKGYTGIVRGFYDWCDYYGRVQTEYIIDENGNRINKNNCVYYA